MNTFLEHISQKFRYGDQIQPARDWYMLLAGAGCLLLVSILWNVWLFNRVVTGGTLSTTNVESPAVFSRSSLDAVEKVFAERAAEEEKYKTGAYIFTDPSR